MEESAARKSAEKRGKACFARILAGHFWGILAGSWRGKKRPNLSIIDKNRPCRRAKIAEIGLFGLIEAIGMQGKRISRGQKTPCDAPGEGAKQVAKSLNNKLRDFSKSCCHIYCARTQADQRRVRRREGELQR